MKPIAFKISDQLADRLAETYGNRNRGAQCAVESWIMLRINTIYELKSLFTKDELYKMLVPASENVIDSKMALSNEMFAQYVKSKFREYPEDDIGTEILLKKIRGLTAAQVYFLLDWLNCFWLIHDTEKVEEYVKKLAMEKE